VPAGLSIIRGPSPCSILGCSVLDSLFYAECRIGMIWRRRLLGLCLVALCGCASVAPPRLLHPGTAQTQQQRAEQFDPYPLPELGPPTEARPRGFLLPQPENERVQNAETFMDRYRQPPPPGVYRPPRPLPRQAVPFVPAPFPQAPAVFVP
jgi:hypothetical protein